MNSIPLSKSLYVINSTLSIRKIYFRIYLSSGCLQEKNKIGKIFLPTFPNLLCDIFCSLYQAQPKTRDLEEVDIRYLINLTILEGLLIDPSYQSIRAKSSFSEVTSLWATEMFADKLLKTLSQQKWKWEINKYKKIHIKEKIVQSKELNILKKLFIDFLNWLASLKRARPGKSKLRKGIGKVRKKMLKVTQKMNQSISSDIENINDVVEICQVWNIDKQSIDKINYKQKMKLAAQLRKNPRLKDLAKIIGHLRHMALHARYLKIREASHEVYNVTFGNDLLKIHPIETICMSRQDFQYDFYQRFARGRLMQYELKESKPTGKGSIIVCVDTSTSMSGKPEMMSKAIALSLLEIARADKRNFVGIIFGRKKKTRTFIFEKEEVKILSPNKDDVTLGFLEGLFEFATGFISDGTDFETPLRTALSIREKKDFYQDADMVFITDDICSISNEFLKYYNSIKKINNITTYGILIGPKYREPGSMGKFCDDVMNYQVFTENMAATIFEKVTLYKPPPKKSAID